MTEHPSFLEKYFYLFMALLIPAIVIYGFSFTIGQNLIHPAIPRPRLLYVHAAIFSGWLVLFLAQSVLVRTANVKIHRTLGWFGLAHGIAIPGIGFPIAVVMARFDVTQLHMANAMPEIIIPFWDMIAFTSTFALAIWFRKQPEFHRRLMLVATCCLTAAAFGRFPEKILPPSIFYAGVDILVLLGVLRDWLVNRRVHPVYVYTLPLLILGQSITTYAAFVAPVWWMRIARAIVG